jgi:superfamily II DNA/RNA helicase
MKNPVTHSVDVSTASVSTMEHHMLLVSKQDKADVITEMAAREGRTIMFVRTKHHVDRLADKLRSVGVRAGALHGGKTQGARNRVLSQFRDGDMPVLVATDVAARGIHVDGVSLVVHVDPPADSKDYLHRAGRTARAGESGTVVTVVTHDQRRTVVRMTDKAGVKPESTKVRPGDADLARITGARTPSGEPVIEKPAPSRGPRGGGGSGGHTPRRGGGDFRRRTGRESHGHEGRSREAHHPRDDRREGVRDTREGGPRREGPRREFRSDAPRREFREGDRRDAPRTDAAPRREFRSDAPRRDNAPRRDDRPAAATASRGTRDGDRRY